MMKCVLQNIKTGATEVSQVPIPSNKPGNLLIKTSRTLISSGTEKMLIEFGKSSFINKARQQPDKVKMVLSKVKTDGLIPTIETVLNKLDKPIPLGYCNVGHVLNSVNGPVSFSKGDRVVSNGKHAEVVRVPVNLCAKVPDNVSDEEAAFTVLAAIALQGVRLAKPTLGETVVVFGLGLIGLLTVQILRAHGCKVIGLDFDAQKLELAHQFGAQVINLSAVEDPVSVAKKYTHNRGVDAVIITAATKSNDPLQNGAKMCRQRGRIILVGVCGLELSRTDFYEKELTFQVSCSYGPGRYDINYEEKGNDYPFGLVRWTEQRNFEAILDMMADGRLNVKPLISHTYQISDAISAYELVASKEYSLGIILQYPDDLISNDQTSVLLKQEYADRINESPSAVNISFIGSGNYASSVLVPSFKRGGANFRTICSSEGVTAAYLGKKFGFEVASTNVESVMDDTLANSIVIATQHDSHASLTLKALSSGKNVFVEKPLCLTTEELDDIIESYGSLPPENRPILMVGFNRRYSPLIKKIKQLLSSSKEPKAITYTINAGKIPADHWTQDPKIGGGRIIGEVCHFVDLLRFITDAPIISCHSQKMESETSDTISLQLKFADGSIGAIHYFANGSNLFPKEKIEIFCSGKILLLDNFRKLIGFGWKNFKKMRLWRQNKGQNECAKEFIEAIKSKNTRLIPFEELVEVSRVCINAAKTLG